MLRVLNAVLFFLFIVIVQLRKDILNSDFIRPEKVIHRVCLTDSQKCDNQK